MTIAYNQKDAETLGKTIWGEARGEPHDGQVAVAWVVRNRSQRPAFVGRVLAAFEGAVAAACLAPYQFSCWNSDDPNCEKLMVLAAADYASQYDIAVDVCEGNVADPTSGADHYFAASIPTPAWAHAMKQTAKIGHHLFFNSQYAPLPVTALGSRGTTVSLLQRALRTAGYYTGPESSVYDSEVYDAVRAYQTARGLSVDGVAGNQTYTSLGIN